MRVSRLTVPECAEALGVSGARVEPEWAAAPVWLRRGRAAEGGAVE
ncbi:MAG TPA: hypothetical protein VMT16_09975 [Thermoanaerobaculia bacterium]|nr:hypothetical protein [Thermoanaerobaculia bacterium]